MMNGTSDSPNPLRARSSSRVENASPLHRAASGPSVPSSIVAKSPHERVMSSPPGAIIPANHSPRSRTSADPKSPVVVLSPMMSPMVSPPPSRLRLDSSDLSAYSPLSSPHSSAPGTPIIGSDIAPKKPYCKFMVLMNNPESKKAMSEEYNKMSKDTKQRTQAYKHYMKRYRVDMFNYLVARKERLRVLEEEMTQQKLGPGEKKCLRDDLAKRESTFLRLKRTRIKINDFQLLSLIGRGGYGEVYLCRKVDTKEIFVLKRMKKSLYLTKNEVPRVQRERDVLSGSTSPWIIKLRFSFQDNEYLYLVMEYAAGGDIKTLMENLGQLDEQMAKFYFAEMLLCVEYLHSLGFVHRDLKPGNFVIDKTGHLKLIDFGLSKDGINSRYKDSFQSWNTMRRTMDLGTLNNTTRLRRGSIVKKPRWGLAYSLVGSPDYMAPEILAREGYDERVDMWALGCCLYEMLSGETPFCAESADMVFVNVMNWQDCIAKPEETELSPLAWDLINNLICDKNKRFTTEEVKKHKFFSDIDWKDLRNKAPPFMPNLDDELDTSYFNTESLSNIIDEESFDSNFNSLIESDPQAHMYFAGFTYKRFDSTDSASSSSSSKN